MQARHTFIVLFRTVILYNRPNVNMLFLFVCLSDCNYRSFPCVSDTLAGDYLSTLLIYRGKVELCHPLYGFRGNNRNDFRGRCRPRKLKSAKNNPRVFRRTAKIWRRENIPLYGIEVNYFLDRYICKCVDFFFRRHLETL